MYYGKYESRDIAFSKRGNKDNDEMEMKRRISMAFLFVCNPDTFVFLVTNHVNLFHGTNGNALHQILKYGLQSGLDSHKNS